MASQLHSCVLDLQSVKSLASLIPLKIIMKIQLKTLIREMQEVSETLLERVVHRQESCDGEVSA